jgi:5-hydroxyisourate hydrolase
MTKPKSPITTHVLDTSLGRPASGVAATLELCSGAGDTWRQVARGVTDGDGRITDLCAPGSLEAATYRLTFDTGAYFTATGRQGFYPYVAVVFSVGAKDEHYHVPLLLNPYGYSTYRGS